MNDEISVYVAPDGDVRFIHDDGLAEVAASLGEISIARASHVEPMRGRAEWYADMSPVAGPFLGVFDTRAEALAAERAWLEDHEVPVPMVAGEGR